jgi:hypothetical protein
MRPGPLPNLRHLGSELQFVAVPNGYIQNLRCTGRISNTKNDSVLPGQCTGNGNEVRPSTGETTRRGCIHIRYIIINDDIVVNGQGNAQLQRVNMYRGPHWW